MQWFSATESITTDPATIAAPTYTKTQTAITGAMTVDENALGLFYGIEIINGAGTVLRRAVGGDDQLPPPGAVTVTINGLTPGTAYTVRGYQSDVALAAI